MLWLLAPDSRSVYRHVRQAAIILALSHAAVAVAHHHHSNVCFVVWRHPSVCCKAELTLIILVSTRLRLSYSRY